MSNSSNASGGIGLGTLVAAILSWSKFHSLGWLIVHAICGWLYVVYYIFGLSS